MPMLKRALFFSTPFSLSLKDNQMVINTKQMPEVKRTVPIEDIGYVVLEHQQTSITLPLLNALSDNNVAVIFCGDNCMPNAMLMNLDSNNTQGESFRAQIEASEPLKKRIWPSVVQQKILNQSSVLRALGTENTLCEIAKRVQSGDADNREAYAAQLYWRLLFGDFTRRDDANIINKALNYGYAIVRGCIARNIVASGLVPCFGIHHDNQLNQFNLVDDMMEPLRPFVDYYVAKLKLSAYTDLTPELKNKLISVLICNAGMNGETISVLKCAEMMAASLARTFRQKDTRLLSLPAFNNSVLNVEDFD